MNTDVVPPAEASVPEPAAAPAVQMEVEHRIGEFTLHADFTIESGLAVLFGPSGAGKSLTLAMIAGLIRPMSGRISIKGRVVADAEKKVHVSTQDRHVGMVFQDGLLLPHRTVLDNVALAVRQKSSRAEKREVARSWLERVGAAEWAKRAPGTLSGGQRQRVGLARGMAGDPAVLLLDEPLSALDQTVRKEMRALIREVITSTGVPSLLVTHDQEEAEELGDLIVGYEYGRITGTRPVNRAGGRWVEVRLPNGTSRHDWVPSEQPPPANGVPGEWHVVRTADGASEWEWFPTIAPSVFPA